MYKATRFIPSPFFKHYRFRQALVFSGRTSRVCRAALSRRSYRLGHSDRPGVSLISERYWTEDLLCEATQLEENQVEQNLVEEDDPGFVGKLSKLLGDVGMGRRSFWEGGVGIFLLGGATVSVMLVSWVRGTQLKQGRPYTVHFCSSSPPSPAFP